MRTSLSFIPTFPSPLHVSPNLTPGRGQYRSDSPLPLSLSLGLSGERVEMIENFAKLI